MNYNELINEKYQQVKQIPGVEIHCFELGDKFPEGEFKQISNALQKNIPEEVINFYGQINGFKLSWSSNVENIKLFGFCNIVDLNTGIFGYSNHDKIVKENRFDDVFWNDSFPSETINKLKEHYLLESFDGQSENTTFTIKNELELYDIYEDEIRLYKISFKDYIAAIVSWGGLFNFRQEILKSGKVPSEPYSKESELWLKLMGDNVK